MIINTKKFVSKKKATELHRLHHHAQSSDGLGTMVFMRGPIEDRVPEQERCWNRFHKAINDTAIQAGLPEPEKDEDGDTIHYGMDFNTGELLGWEPDE